MNIWFTEIGEPLPLEGDVRLHRYGNLTRALVGLGHEVTWWTSNFSHANKTFVCDEDREELFEGVTLRILKGPGYPRNVSFKRFRHQADFAKRFYAEAKKYPLPDLIVSPIPTLEVAEVAVRFGKEHNIPVVTDIRDEWPQEFVELAPKPMQWMAKIALQKSFSRAHYICQNVAGILGISERQLGYGLKLAKRAQGNNDGVFPLGYEPTPVPAEKRAAAREWWKQQGVTSDRFVICLFATISPFLNLRTVIAAARILEKEFPLQFVLCGHGRSLDEMKALAKDVPSVLFPGWVDGPKIAALMEISSAGIAPYAADTAMALPNKPFEYLSGGLPVISSIQGELRGVLSRADCGRTYHPESVPELSEIVRELHRNPEKRRAMGERGRKLLEERYSIPVIARGLSEHLEKVRERFLDN